MDEGVSPHLAKVSVEQSDEKKGGVFNKHVEYLLHDKVGGCGRELADADKRLLPGNRRNRC